MSGGTLPRRIPADVDVTNKPKIFSPTKTVTGTHKVQPKDMDDLIHLQGPLTEDAVMRTLQARFNDGKYFVSSFDPNRDDFSGTRTKMNPTVSPTYF